MQLDWTERSCNHIDGARADNVKWQSSGTFTIYVRGLGDNMTPAYSRVLRSPRFRIIPSATMRHDERLCCSILICLQKPLDYTPTVQWLRQGNFRRLGPLLWYSPRLSSRSASLQQGQLSAVRTAVDLSVTALCLGEPSAQLFTNLSAIPLPGTTAFEPL